MNRIKAYERNYPYSTTIFVLKMSSATLYVPVNNFSVMPAHIPVFLCRTCTKLRIMCLPEGHNAVSPVSFEPVTIQPAIEDCMHAAFLMMKIMTLVHSDNIYETMPVTNIMIYILCETIDETGQPGRQPNQIRPFTLRSLRSLIYRIIYGLGENSHSGESRQTFRLTRVLIFV